MSRGARTTPEARRYVIGRALEEPKTADRTELARKIRRELLAKKIIPPAVSTLKSMVSTARNRKTSPEDQPWHMGTFKLYNPSAVGLAEIVAAYRFAARHDAALTIRQAKWIGRLSAVPKRLFPDFSDEEVTTWLIIWACDYADDEVWSEVAKEPLNTADLDSLLAEDPDLRERMRRGKFPGSFMSESAASSRLKYAWYDPAKLRARFGAHGSIWASYLRGFDMNGQSLLRDLENKPANRERTIERLKRHLLKGREMARLLEEWDIESRQSIQSEFEQLIQSHTEQLLQLAPEVMQDLKNQEETHMAKFDAEEVASVMKPSLEEIGALCRQPTKKKGMSKGTREAK